jgi:hypothetical protein
MLESGMLSFDAILVYYCRVIAELEETKRKNQYLETENE